MNAYIHWQFILVIADGNINVYLCCLYDMTRGKLEENMCPHIRNQCFLNQNNDIRTFLKQHIIHIFYSTWSWFLSCRRPWPNRPELCILSKMLYRLLLPNLAEIPGLSPVISAWHVIWHYCYSMHHSKHCLFSRWTSWNEWGSEACSWYWKQGQ